MRAGREMLAGWREGATFGHPEGPCQPGLPAAEGRMSETLARENTGLDIEAVNSFSLLQKRG